MIKLNLTKGLLCFWGLGSWAIVKAHKASKMIVIRKSGNPVRGIFVILPFIQISPQLACVQQAARMLAPGEAQPSLGTPTEKSKEPAKLATESYPHK